MTIKEFYQKASEMMEQVDFSDGKKGIILMTIEPSPTKEAPNGVMVGLKVMGENEQLAHMVCENMEHSDDLAPIILSASAAYMDGDQELQKDFFEAMLANCSCPACQTRRAAETIRDTVRGAYNAGNKNIN